MADTIEGLLGPPPTTGGKPTAASLLGPKPTSEGGHGARAVMTDAGRRIKSLMPSDYPALPFIDRSILSQMSNKDEAKAFLEKKYGSGSVSEDKRGLVVTVDGKKMRARSGMIDALVGSAPKTALGIAGAVGGAELGPGGSFAGAGIGMAAGQAIEEGVKSATGVQRKSAGGIVGSVADAAVAGVEGEATGRVLKAVPSRLTRGPLPNWITGTRKDVPGGLSGKERVDLIQDLTKKGAHLQPQATMPGSRVFARHALMADKIVGRDVKSEQANLDVLKGEVSRILDKAGVKGSAKLETMGRLEGETSEMDFQQTGQMIQYKAKFLLDKMRAAAKAGGKKPNAKEEAYLSQLAAPGAKPVDIYDLVTRKGETDMMERFFKLAGDKPGKESDVVIAIRQRAVRQILAGALKRSQSGEAVGAIDAELSRFTVKQQKMLFPDGLAENLRLLSKQAQMVFPHIEDPAMGGMAAGEILGRSAIKFPKFWKSRLVRQGYEALWRTALTSPKIVQRLAVGFKGNSAQRIAARNGLRAILYSGFVQADEGDESTNP